MRDKSFGVPHIYGTTRAGTMFGAGYAAAQDRLFFIDVLRHLGRAQLSSFIGGAPANRAMDAEQWTLAPYTEADYQRQFDLGDDLYGDRGRQLQDDALATSPASTSTSPRRGWTRPRCRASTSRSGARRVPTTGR